MYRGLVAGVLGAWLALGCGKLAGLDDLVFSGPNGGGGSSQGGGAGSGGAGSGGDGASGGTAPDGCGTIAALSDDFDDGLPGRQWSATTDAGTSIIEQLGTVSFALPAEATPAQVYYFSHYRYDMRGGEVSVAVPAMLDTARDGQAFLRVIQDDANLLAIEQHLGELVFVVRRDGDDIEPALPVPYDAVAHRWWRIADDGENVTFDTSEDGAIWHTAASVATGSVASLEYVNVVVGAEAFGGDAEPGTVQFDDLNTRSPQTPLCKAGTFTDDFEDGIIGPAWGRSMGDTAIATDEIGGELRLTLATDRPDSLWLQRTARAFDFTDESLTVELTGPPGHPLTWALAGIEALDSQGVMFHAELYLTNSVLYLRSIIGTVTQEEESAAFDLETQRYLRLTADDDEVRSFTSSDGSTWLPHQTITTHFPVSMVGLYLGAATWQGDPSGDVVRFGSVNVAP